MSTSIVVEEPTPKVLVVMSTFANALQREFPEFRRCNQDELGKRRNVENAVRAALARGQSVCVDRTNIDPGQRRTWIEIAHEYPNVEIWGVQMDTPYEMCSERLATRADHPTIKTPEVAQEVLSRFARDFVPINSFEGFNRVYHILPHPSPDYTHDEIENILASIRKADFHEAPLPPPTNVAVSPYPSRSRGFYPHRGGGRVHTGNQKGRSVPLAIEPQSWRSGSGTGTPQQQWSDWRSRDGGARGFGGDGRRPYRGRYWGGHRGWGHSPYGSQSSSRDGSHPSRDDRTLPDNQSGHRGGVRVSGEAVAAGEPSLSISTPELVDEKSAPAPADDV